MKNILKLKIVVILTLTNISFASEIKKEKKILAITQSITGAWHLQLAMKESKIFYLSALSKFLSAYQLLDSNSKAPNLLNQFLAETEKINGVISILPHIALTLTFWKEPKILCKLLLFSLKDEICFKWNANAISSFLTSYKLLNK